MRVRELAPIHKYSVRPALDQSDCSVCYSCDLNQLFKHCLVSQNLARLLWWSLALSDQTDHRAGVGGLIQPRLSVLVSDTGCPRAKLDFTVTDWMMVTG